LKQKDRITGWERGIPGSSFLAGVNGNIWKLHRVFREKASYLCMKTWLAEFGSAPLQAAFAGLFIQWMQRIRR
jgi:hypothetical protein